MKNYAIKLTGMLAFALALSLSAAAQETRSEVSIQGTGFFTKDTNSNGIRQQNTNSGGFQLGYRYNINNWLAAEGDYGWTRNSQLYFTPAGFAGIRANVHQVTGVAVVKLPAFGRIRPYGLAGGGALIFDPSDDNGFSSGVERQTRGTFVYGGGADYALMHHVALRAEYRGFVYKAPDFGISSLNADSWTHTAQPSAGFVLKF